MVDPASETQKSSSTGVKNKSFEDIVFLVVDDHAFVRHIVIESLKVFGAKKIVTAQDGDEALALLNKLSPNVNDASLKTLLKDRPDIAGDLFPAVADFTKRDAYCIISDFKMPGTNGLQLLKAIRCGKTGAPRQSPVILLTSFADDYVVYAALQLDVHAFVVKPVSRNSLKAKVERALAAQLELKSVGEYAAIDIPDETGRTIGGTKAVPRPLDTLAKGGPEIRWLPIVSVPPGTVLARDINSESGALLLKAGAALTAAMIEKLVDAAEMKAFNGQVPVAGK